METVHMDFDELALKHAFIANKSYGLWQEHANGTPGPDLPDSGKNFWKARFEAEVCHTAHLLEMAGVLPPDMAEELELTGA